MRKQSTSETNDLWLQTIFLTQETGRRKLQFLTEKEKNDEEEKKKKTFNCLYKDSNFQCVTWRASAYHTVQLVHRLR